jgi:hypothetical protein
VLDRAILFRRASRPVECRRASKTIAKVIRQRGGLMTDKAGRRCVLANIDWNPRRLPYTHDVHRDSASFCLVSIVSTSSCFVHSLQHYNCAVYVHVSLPNNPNAMYLLQSCFVPDLLVVFNDLLAPPMADSSAIVCRSQA